MGIHKYCLPLLTSLTLLSCSLGTTEQHDGYLVLHMQSPNPLTKASETLYRVDCHLLKASRSIQNATFLESDGFFNIQFQGIEPGEDYALLLWGKDSTQVTATRAYADKIEVNEKDTTHIMLVWNPFLLSLETPAEGEKNNILLPTLTWRPIEIGMQYRLQVDTTRFFNSPLIDFFDNKSNTYTFKDTLSDGLYYWRISCRDFAGNWSDWSRISSFILDTEAPPVPVQTRPANGTTITSSYLFFQWRMPEIISWYRFQISDSDDFTHPIVDNDNVLTSEYYIPNFAALLTNGIYFWRVRGRDELFNWSDWSDTFSFRVDSH